MGAELSKGLDETATTGSATKRASKPNLRAQAQPNEAQRESIALLVPEGV